MTGTPPETEPNVKVVDFLTGSWDNANTGLPDSDAVHTDAPKVTTGWYDDAYGGAQVAVTATDEQPGPGAGATGVTHVSGDGTAGQYTTGVVLVTAFAGDSEWLADAGPGGSRLNGKKLSWQLYREAYRIVSDNVQARGTDYEWFYPADRRRIPPNQNESGKRVHAVQMGVGYGYKA